jgi:hypothetical protein
MSERLISYDETRRALAEATRVGEVKTIRDKAAAVLEYAKRARNGDMVVQALDIQWQATRKLGQLLIEMAERGERQRRGGDRKSKSHHVTLIDLSAIGITKMQSYRAQVLARMSDATFRHHFDAAVHRVLSAIAIAVSREQRHGRKRRLFAAAQNAELRIGVHVHVRSGHHGHRSRQATGVDVGVILDRVNQQKRYTGATYDKVRVDRRSRPDHRELQFHPSGQQRNAENVLVVHDDPVRAKAYAENWRRRAAASHPS